MIKVRIAVVPDAPLTLEDQQRYGRYTSNERQINVNLCTGVPWAYSILIIPDDLSDLQAPKALQNWLGMIVATLKKNIQDDIEIQLATSDEWRYFGIPTNDELYQIWQITDRTLQQVCQSGRVPGLSYVPLVSRPDRDEITVKDILSGNIPMPDLGSYANMMDDEDEDDGDWDEDDDDEDALAKALRRVDRDDYDRPKLGPSKVLAHAKNPKRDLNRHGVIIADRRDDIDRDRKMIKNFLKEFIPGNQYWKKELRRTLCQRWIRVYAVSKKTHRELEKEFRKSKHARAAESVLSITHGLFTTPLDSWDDPSR